MSATAFSIHCKRQQTPNKQGDDGWKSVLYEGLALDTFRRRLLSKSGDALDLPINDEVRQLLRPGGRLSTIETSLHLPYDAYASMVDDGASCILHSFQPCSSTP